MSTGVRREIGAVGKGGRGCKGEGNAGSGERRWGFRLPLRMRVRTRVVAWNTLCVDKTVRVNAERGFHVVQ